MLAQLDTKTVYTFMESLITIPRYVATAKELGYSHLGMMDVDNLYGAYSFIEECQKNEIQPLIGLDLTLIKDEFPIEIRLLALSTQGYRKLLKISTRKMLGQTQWEDIADLLGEGLALIVPYQDGIEELDLGIPYYIGVFPDTPPVSLRHPSLPLVTVRYFEQADLETLQMLKAIKQNTNLREVPRIQKNQGLLSSQDLAEVFRKHYPESLENLSALLDGVDYQLDKTLKLPRFNPERPAVEELREVAERGLSERGLTDLVYQTRLNQELEVIHQMGFDDYFLIVWDLLRFGRKQGYYMGMGRGSAVGSLVAYALSITGINPVKHQLIFERFLNRERHTLPDIDIDIPDVYRPEFIRYVRDRYGSYHAAQIVTYSTFGAKQAIRDVFKRYGVPEYELTNITKKIHFKDNLTSAYEKNISFRQVIQSKLEYQKAFEIAKKIEGNPRQTSIHAAGVVMSDKDLTDFIPLKHGEDMYITQYDAHGVESNGLLKMDFLGLRNLTFVQRMKEAVLDKYGVEISIEGIDLEDKETLALFARGDTKGIFQFEQAGAISLLRRVQPVKFEEVVATTSLNRPGASDYIDNFVKRKHGQEKVEMIDSSLSDILAPTYGIMLYQEQVMQVAQRFGGFSLGKADILRRAMGKKNAAEMHQMEAEFVQGAVALGHTESKAKEVFAVMEKFAGYGFNRSHAYAYSALAFQLAYFKAHYPDIFFDVMLNLSSSEYITDALHFQFELAPLNINTIPYHDKFEDKKIYMGLKNIKGLPRDLAFWIIENRPFSSVEDFILKLPTTYKKTSLLQPLIELGLFDIFEKNRRKVLENLENLFVFADELGSFFAETNYSWIETQDYSDAEKFELEQKIIGVGISPHPLKIIAERHEVAIQPLDELTEHTRVTILIEIQSIKVIRTKNGENMAFLQVSDTKQKLDVTLFPDTYRQLETSLKEKGFYYLTGKINERDGRLQMILERSEEVSLDRFWIQVSDHENDDEISKILRKFSGNIPVIIRYENEKRTVSTSQVKVRKSDTLQNELKNLTMKTIFR